MNVYRSITPTDTPELSMGGSLEPSSYASEGVELDINLNIFDDKWQPFGLARVNGLCDMNDFNNTEDEGIDICPTVFDEKQPVSLFHHCILLQQRNNLEKNDYISVFRVLLS
jgi:hypothetical protein